MEKDEMFKLHDEALFDWAVDYFKNSPVNELIRDSEIDKEMCANLMAVQALAKSSADREFAVNFQRAAIDLLCKKVYEAIKHEEPAKTEEKDREDEETGKNDFDDLLKLMKSLF